MNYLILTVAMIWFPQPDYCQLSVVECYQESKEYVLEEVKKAGLDSDFVDLLIQCESGWRQNAVGYNRNGSVDKSYWQINSIHKLSDDCLNSVPCSTKWAIEKIKRDVGISAWSCSRKIILQQNKN